MSEKPQRTKRRKVRSAGQVIKRGENKYLIRICLGLDSTGKRHNHNETFHGGAKAADKRRRDLLAQGLSAGSVAYVHTLLRSIFKLAVQRQKIARNPMDGVKSPGGKKLEQQKAQRREERTMSADQVIKFLNAAGDTRFGVVCALAFFTGCRPGELLGLKWADYNASTREIKIRQAITWRGKDDC